MHTYKFGEINHLAILLEDALSDDEPASQGPPLLLTLFLDSLQDLLKTVDIVVVVPPHGRAADVDTLLNSEVDATVGDNDIPTLAEGRNNGGDGREVLGVEDSILCAEEVGNVTLECDVDVWRSFNLAIRSIKGDDTEN
jgi:hypothetical protein